MQHTEKIILSEDIYQRGRFEEKFRQVRNFTEFLCEPLEKEDYVIQSMSDVSPAKWHLAHTTWFFEAFILAKAIKNYKPFHPQYNFLFNSYYVKMGERFKRNQRGVISRPGVDEIFKYRRYVDEQILSFITSCSEKLYREYSYLIEIGMNHEQQHQELLLTDIKHVFSLNPLHPVYRFINRPDPVEGPAKTWIEAGEGVYEIGSDGSSFSYDNEYKRHKKFISSFCISSGLITNEEYIGFIEDNGYNRPGLWLSDGFEMALREEWSAPLYWEKIGDNWYYFTLAGFEKVKRHEPVCHVSYYEADAFARWKNKRLPSEEEWEISAPDDVQGNLADEKIFHPAAMWTTGNEYQQFYGDAWEWTGSAYLPYPGFTISDGALGEYNGKFMSGQMVLRGGSCATSKSHIRNTYRNFFPPGARWQFSGIRLASDTNE